MASPRLEFDSDTQTELSRKFMWYSTRLLNATEQQPGESDAAFGQRNIAFKLETVTDSNAPFILKAEAYTVLSAGARESRMSYVYLQFAEESLKEAKTTDLETEFPGLLDSVETLLKHAWLDLHKRTVVEDPGEGGNVVA